MNKHLQALNVIDSYLPKDVRNVREAVITLREIIDNYEKLEQENVAYKYLFKKDTADKNNANIEKVSVYYENKILEKSLDSACEIISQFDKKLSDEFGCCCKTKEQWKEWLIKK